jgi:hypothetical protein
MCIAMRSSLLCHRPHDRRSIAFLQALLQTSLSQALCCSGITDLSVGAILRAKLNPSFQFGIDA